MLFMIAFWTFFTLFLTSLRFSKRTDFSAALFCTATASLIVAIATKDPIFTQFGVPAEFEWVIGVGFAFFSSWKFYLNPLKNKVLHIEKDLTRTNTTIHSLVEDFKPIQQRITHMEKDISSTKSTIESLKEDMTLVKEVLIGRKTTG